jgi:hypothetical protein
MVEYLEIDGLYAFVRWAVENLRVGIFPILSIWSPLVAISRGPWGAYIVRTSIASPKNNGRRGSGGRTGEIVGVEIPRIPTPCSSYVETKPYSVKSYSAEIWT